MAFTDSYSFSHRFSSDKATSDTAGYQEIIHQCQEVNAFALTRQFYQFALGCGYAPQSMVDAFETMASEYGEAHCDYNTLQCSSSENATGLIGWREVV